MFIMMERPLVGRRITTLSMMTATVGFFATPVLAEGFQRIDDERKFVSLMQDRDLKGFGIRLQVNDNGQIAGRAFGRSVSGTWKWSDGFFCRDLYLGGKEFDPDYCQLVEVQGDTIRFTSDMGRGDSADLRIE